MTRERYKWKFVFFLLLLNTVIRSLPIENSIKLTNLVTVDTSFPKLEVPQLHKTQDELNTDDKENPLENVIFHDESTTNMKTIETNKTEQVLSEDTNKELVPIRDVSQNVLRNALRPGQEVRQYVVELTFNGGTFTGRAVIDVRLTRNTDYEMKFHVEELDIQSVMVGVFTDANAVGINFEVDDGELTFEPELEATSYIVIIEYSGQVSGVYGLFEGGFEESSYVAMNLHPTNARRVFPCMDEPTLASTVTFTFNNLPFPNIIANTMLEEGSTTQFRPLQGPPHLWGMVAHNFPDVIIPLANVQLHGRLGARFQDALASVAINNYFNALEEWTNKPYFEIVLNQQERLHIFALPDTSTDWYALSTVCMWEPDVLMSNIHTVKQRKNAIVKIAEALARQWFGYVIYPENWNSQWVVSGLVTYSAYEVAKNFQQNPLGEDLSLVDMNTIFVTDVIQESMYYDAYSSSLPLETEELIFDESFIRENVNGLLKYKAPAILRMIRLILGREDNDYIQMAAQALLSSRALQTVSSLNFIDAINSNWFFTDNKLIDDLAEFLIPWVNNRGYPMITVGLRQNGVYVNQEYFSFSNNLPVTFSLPLTFTTSINPNYEMENVYNIQMMDSTVNIDMILDAEEGDYVLFNIQGQGYYRVNYDEQLWERIIEALEDPERREQIHPLNRAKLVDDALNLARADKLSYDTAFRVVLTMEHETEYAVWKAFVRNMDFLRKRLVALVEDDGDDELDPDIYLRMVRRTVIAVERELGFNPDPLINEPAMTFVFIGANFKFFKRMVRRTVIAVERELGFNPDPLINEPAMTSLTRALVMDHACRANYRPCIAAAVDLFYDPNSSEREVNPDIPPELRPVVYCTMAREGDAQVIAALNNRLEIEESMYERVVILESLACSRDDGFINSLLMDTITGDRYGLEERMRIFKAVTESSYQNARIARNFLSERTTEIRNNYGGPQKLEELIKIVADNAVGDIIFDFRTWVTSTQSNLEDSEDMALRMRDQVTEDELWDTRFRDVVYEWIDENDAPTIAASLLLLTLSLFVTLYNH